MGGGQDELALFGTRWCGGGGGLLALVCSFSSFVIMVSFAVAEFLGVGGAWGGFGEKAGRHLWREENANGVLRRII